MISHDVIQRKSLFALLHKIDLDLAETARLKRCPTVGGRCIMRLMRENLGVVPRTLLRSTQFA